MEHIHVKTYDALGDPVDPAQLALKVLSSGDAELLSRSLAAPGDGPLTRAAKGDYYFILDTSADPFNITDDFTFLWSMRETATSSPVNEAQTVKIISSRTMRYVQALRLQIDKMKKFVNADPDALVSLGYTDAQLIQYLEHGLSRINEYQPYPMWITCDDFPEGNKGLLIDAALLAGVMSQQIFAIDADVEGYSDNGQVFTLNHQPKLAGVLNQLTADLNVRIPAMKMHYVSMGTVSVQVGPHARYAALITAAPLGTGFRNVYFASS